MAPFSKHSDHDDSDARDSGSEPTPVGAGSAGTEPTAAAASVGITVAAYRGLGAAPEPRAPETPAAGTPSAARGAGSSALRDNATLRDALAALPVSASGEDTLNVARQLMQGNVYLRVNGDARALLAEGKHLPIGVATIGDKQYVLAFSSGPALRASIAADRGAGSTAMGQPVRTVLRYVLGGAYAGLILDHASAPARAVLPRDLLEKLVAQAEPSLELKTLVAGERTPSTASEVARALTRVKFWVAVNTVGDALGVAEARTADGARLLELYSHPLEVAALRRGDRAAPMSAGQLAAALKADEGIAGVLVDSGGPWIRLSRDELAPVLSLPV